MRLGIFGGTFDPVHVGHLLLAEQCREQARLDEVWFVPSARPPHKAGEGITAFDKRVEMLQLAIAGHPKFRVEDMEKDRPGPSFTADTLSELRQRLPDAELHLVLGSDCLPDIMNWRDPVRIMKLATLLVGARPDFPVSHFAQLRADLRNQEIHTQVVAMPLIEMSSRDLRRRVAEGRSIRYFVPASVATYISEKGLYK